MRKRVRQVEKKRLVSLRRDEVDRSFGVATGKRRLVYRMGLDHLLILEDRRLALVIAEQQPPEVVEATIARQ